MAAERICPRCGTPLSSDSLEGLCPKCVRKIAFERLPDFLQAPEEGQEISAATVTSVMGAELAGCDPEKAGERIGNYKLLEQIGQGGFGTVWVAEQERPVRRRVALKIIKLGMDTREVVARFEQERQALAMMDHPNIAKVFDAGATQWGRPFFVMELVRGIRITDYCDEANLTTVERLQLFIAVCKAVQHAHQKGIIHRDLKPSNILVTLHDGVPVPKVIDFGVAKATQQQLTDLTIYTQLQQMIGTPLYMSPEQAEMSGLDIDTRSDIYSLGVLLYELLTGRTPFDPGELMRKAHDEIRRVIREQEPPKPSTALQTMAAEVRTGVAQRRRADGAKMAGMLRGDLDWIVMKALEKDRARRYETANSFAEDIQRHLASEPVTAAAPGMAYLFRKFARRHKAALAVAALISVVLVAATVISVWQAGLAREAASAFLKARNDAAEKAASERAAREDSEAITKLLMSVFQSPDPSRDGRKITAVEILDSAAKKLDTQLATQPARKAQMQYALGLTYHALGLAAEAVPLLEAARDYYRTTFGPAHPASLTAVRELSFSLAGAGRQTEALQLQEEALVHCRSVYDPEHPDMLAMLGSLANSYAVTGRRDEALKLWEQVLPLMRKVHGAMHRDTLAAMANLAVSYEEAGRKVEALKLRDEMLTASREVNGPRHPDTLLAMNNLALSYDATDRRPEALALREEVIKLMLEVNGPKHTETLTAMTNLAISHGRAGNLDEALKMSEDVLELRREANGPDHPETLMAMTNLAVTYGKSRRTAEAIEMQEKALVSMRGTLPPTHPYLAGAMQIMSALYWEAGRREEAQKLRMELEAMQKEAGLVPGGQSEPSPEVPADSGTAPVVEKQKVKQLEEALETLRKSKPAAHADTIAAMIELGAAYSAEDSGRKAIKLLEEALPLARRVLPGDKRTIQAMKLLIPLYKSVDLDDEARRLEAEIQSLTAE
jgi:tetratricopeptide (TPR) repeat protein